MVQWLDVMVACDEAFAKILVGLDDAGASENAESLFGLNADLELACYDAGWLRFLNENGGGETNLPLGMSVLNSMARPLRPFYKTIYQTCMESGQPYRHRYQCSSSELFRVYEQTIYSLPKEKGVIVVNHLIIVRPHADEAELPTAERFVSPEDGMIRQCGSCRKVQHAGEKTWHWVPVWVLHPPKNLKADVCPGCRYAIYGV